MKKTSLHFGMHNRFSFVWVPGDKCPSVIQEFNVIRKKKVKKVTSLRR